MKLLSLFFILQSLSLLIVCLYQLYLSEVPRPLAFIDYHSVKTIESKRSQLPTSITISDLDINIPVEQATVVENKWPTTDKGASYLTSSPLPGKEGNSIIYAHNWRSLFGNLVRAKVGQEVVIIYPNNIKKTFVIAYTSVVSPNESTILAPSNDKRVTLYTCTGLLDSQRFVAVALLKS